MSLPKDATGRKEVPIYRGLLMYFPDAVAAVAQCSFIGSQQHNPGADPKWDRSKSGDEYDALMRHLMEAGTRDSDGIRHSTKVAWRALAALQKELEADARPRTPAMQGAEDAIAYEYSNTEEWAALCKQNMAQS